MEFYQIIDKNRENLKNSCIALIGGGGKTSFMRQVGLELANYFQRILITSLTKSEFDEKVILLDKIFGKLDFSENPLFLMKFKQNNQKLTGISEIELENIYPLSDITIFECDGAQKLPLKIHNNFDPIVPTFATHTIIFIGADAVNTKLSDGKIHRQELFKQFWRINDNFVLDCEFIAEVVTSKNGYLSKIHHDPKLIYFVNKADKFPENAENLAKSIFQKSNHPTFFGSIHSGFWEQIR
ncbi:MAG: putative selenium-dependent hydroxylase accessory protein YqeC [Candidatus Marinimicrobia bacterium]|nr:putative selenium-dependent hydroxylase accessory protein YqeC [Candidatus Neomarinimicrobiota bacterium]